MRERGARAPLTATFFAFRARTGVFLFPSALLYFVGVGVIGAAFTLVNHDAIRLWMHGGEPPAFAQIWPSAALAVLLQRILAAAWEAGALRWMILGEPSGVFGLSFGAATFRVFAAHLAWAAFLALGVGLMWLTHLGLDAAIAPVEALADSAAWFFRDIAFPGLKVLVALALVAVAVKLSPAAALTAALDRFAFFSAWRITRGRFWALVGSFVALGSMATVLATLCALGMLVVMLSSVWLGVSLIAASAPAFAWLSLARFGVSARAVQAAAEEA